MLKLTSQALVGGFYFILVWCSVACNDEQSYGQIVYYKVDRNQVISWRRGDC